VTVIAEGTDPVWCMQNLMQFYAHESCGQCTPCREGSSWLERICDKILDGTATMEELDGLHDVINGIMGNTICAFGEGTAMPAMALLQKFRPVFEAYVRGERKRADAKLTVTPWS
jgi:NADH-quinone oxidoreductase subunit F